MWGEIMDAFQFILGRQALQSHYSINSQNSCVSAIHSLNLTNEHNRTFAFAGIMAKNQ